jgi:hypothetical protein
MLLLWVVETLLLFQHVHARTAAADAHADTCLLFCHVQASSSSISFEAWPLKHADSSLSTAELLQFNTPPLSHSPHAACTAPCCSQMPARAEPGQGVAGQPLAAECWLGRVPRVQLLRPCCLCVVFCQVPTGTYSLLLSARGGPGCGREPASTPHTDDTMSSLIPIPHV